MAGYIIHSLDWDRFRRFVDSPTPAQLAALGQLLAEGLEEEADELDEDDLMADWPTDAAGLARVAAERLALPDWYGDLSGAGKDLWESTIFDVCTGECDEIDVGFRVDSDGVYWDVIELAWKHLGVVPQQVAEVALSAFGERPFRYHPPAAPGASREQYDSSEADRRASLDAVHALMGRFLAGEGPGDLDSLLDELDREQGIAGQHKAALHALFTDEDADGDLLADEEWDDWRPMHSMHTPDEVQAMLAELRSIDGLMRAAAEDVRGQYTEELLPALERIAGEGRMLFVQVDT